ncbi:MAG: PDZ domain-containing protein [Roseibacillus sp.]
MRALILLSILLASPLMADLDELCRQLMSEDFSLRQEAEKDLAKWAHEAEKGERAEALFQRYLVSEDPEEYHRLTKVLLEVHFALKKSSIPQQGPGFIGIRMSTGERRLLGEGRLEDLREPQDGVLIEAVIEGTPAEKAGLKAGDLVTEIEGQSIAGETPSLKLKEIVGGTAPGKAIALTVMRGEEKLQIKVTLMNGKAVPPPRFIQEEARIDFEKAEQLLREDYLRWIVDQRKAARALKP